MQAYVLGVFTCVAIFIAFNFVLHPSKGAGGHRRRGGVIRKNSPWRQKRSRTNRSHDTAKFLPTIDVRPSIHTDGSKSPGKDRVYHRLTSRIRERSAARVLQKSERMSIRNKAESCVVNGNNVARSTQSYDDSANVICRIIDHRRELHPIARNRARYNQKKGMIPRHYNTKKMTPKNFSKRQPTIISVSSYNSSDIWATTSSTMISDESYELFKHMSSHPLHRETKETKTDAAVNCEKKTLSESSSTGPDVRLKSNGNATKSIATLRSVQLDKENINVQLAGRNGEEKDATPKIKNGMLSTPCSTYISSPEQTPPASNTSPTTNEDQHDANITDAKRKNTGVSGISNHFSHDKSDSSNPSPDMTLLNTPSPALKPRDEISTSDMRASDTTLNEEPINPIVQALPELEIKSLKAKKGSEKKLDTESAELPSDESNNSKQGRLTVLISNGVFEYKQAADQKAAIDLMNDLRIPYDVVDGMSPEQKESRDIFFGISGMRGNYPQMFQSIGNSHKFLGGYEWLSGSNVEDLEAILGIEQGLSPAFKSSDTVHQNNLEGAPPIPAESSKTCLTVLISEGVSHYTQAANQKSTLNLLNDLGIKHNIINGMDPAQKETRDKFFEISGIRGNYPQLFLSSRGNHSFLGGYDWLEKNLDSKDLASLGR